MKKRDKLLKLRTSLSDPLEQCQVLNKYKTDGNMIVTLLRRSKTIIIKIISKNIRPIPKKHGRVYAMF